MRVICHDICGIGNDGAIYELVVIWVYRNKIESELGINANRVVCSENCRDNNLRDGWRQVSSKDLGVFL